MTASLQIPNHGLKTSGEPLYRLLDWAAWLQLKAEGGPLTHDGIQLGRQQARDLSAVLRRAAKILKLNPPKPPSSLSLKHAPRLDVETPESVVREVWIDWLDRMTASERHSMKLSKRAAGVLADLLRE